MSDNQELEVLQYALSAYMVDLNNYKGKCSRLEEEIEVLKEENEKLKRDKVKDTDHLLDVICHTYYPTFSFYPSKISNYCENIYHRTSRQLKEYLIRNDFPVDTVSRSSVGDKEYYNIEFNVPNDEWRYDKTSDCKMAELLDIKGIGLVDYYEHDGIIHEVHLIDEKELNDKYLIDGNLEFKG